MNRKIGVNVSKYRLALDMLSDRLNDLSDEEYEVYKAAKVKLEAIELQNRKATDAYYVATLKEFVNAN